VDALIMAAGRGSRLGSHTDERPKALVDLGGISPLELQLEILVSRGIRRVILVTGYQREMTERAAAERLAGRAKLDIVWNPFWSVTNVIGSAWIARDRLQGAFVYLHADTVLEPSIVDDLLSADGAAALAIDFRACEPEQMKAEVTDGRVVYLSKELAVERTAGEFIGVGVFGDEAVAPVIEGLDAVLAQGTLQAYFEAAINHAVLGGLDVVPVPTNGRSWTEIDFEEDLALARSILPRLDVAGDGTEGGHDR
jgi:L-glutamine-phosphate cytidylyltransferase